MKKNRKKVFHFGAHHFPNDSNHVFMLFRMVRGTLRLVVNWMPACEMDEHVK